MKKKFLVPALAVAVAGGGIAGSVLNLPAFAAGNGKAKQTEVSDKDDQKQLAKQAKISKDESVAIALKALPGKLKGASLEDEDGNAVYAVSVFDKKGEEQEVKVDAKSGKVLKVEASGEEATGDDHDKEVADDQEQAQLEKAAKLTKDESVAIALKKVPGKLKDASLEDEDGKPVYAVDIFDKNGQEQEIKVDAVTGKVLHVEADGSDNDGKDHDKEVADDQEQAQLEKAAKLTKDESVAIALKKVPGKLKDDSLEDEDGKPVYAVDIFDKNGQEQEVKVDAVTGKVLHIEADGNENEQETNDDSE